MVRLHLIECNFLWEFGPIDPWVALTLMQRRPNENVHEPIEDIHDIWVFEKGHVGRAKSMLVPP